MSLLASFIETMRKAFSISAVRAIGSDLNFTRTSNNCGMRLVQLLSDRLRSTCFQTTRTLVVSVSRRRTA